MKELIPLDGAIGTELQKRGVKMDGSWCGSASLHQDILKNINQPLVLMGYMGSGKTSIGKKISKI